MDKDATKQIKKNRRKERKKTSKKDIYNMILSTRKRLAEMELTKQQQANFIAIGSSTIFKEVGDKFHHNFKEGMQVHLLGYIGVNLGSMIKNKNKPNINEPRLECKRKGES